MFALLMSSHRISVFKCCFVFYFWNLTEILFVVLECLEYNLVYISDFFVFCWKNYMQHNRTWKASEEIMKLFSHHQILNSIELQTLHSYYQQMIPTTLSIFNYMKYCSHMLKLSVGVEELLLLSFLYLSRPLWTDYRSGKTNIVDTEGRSDVK